MNRTNLPSRRARLALGAVGTLVGALAGVAPANAEIFGILNGRSAAPPTEQLSVEGGLQFGDDVFYVGGRGNYAVSPTVTGFVNLSRFDFDNGGDGFQIGGGAFLHLVDQRVAPSLDLAVKPSLGYADLDGGNVITLGGELLVSGRDPLGGGSLGWYANVGLLISRADADNGGDDTDLEPIVGAGITLPVGSGTFYAGIDFIDELALGVGFRLGL